MQQEPDEFVEGTKESIARFISRRTIAEWRNSSKPYMLNQISPELMSKDIDYKKVIYPLTLKQFAMSIGPDVKMIIHPTQKSKIGLVPKDQMFDFQGTEAESDFSQRTSSSSPKKHYKISRAKFAVLNFLDALNKLDDKELESVVIPVSVLAKLVGVTDED
jgi:hypothetical protein